MRHTPRHVFQVIGGLEPLSESSDEIQEGFEFENRAIGNNIPGNFIPAIEKGFREACEEGPLIGHPVSGLRAYVLSCIERCLLFMKFQVYLRRRSAQRGLQRAGVQADSQRRVQTGDDVDVVCLQCSACPPRAQAMESAGAKILEPVMKVEVSGPEEYQGVLVASINRRKGVIQV